MGKNEKQRVVCIYKNNCKKSNQHTVAEIIILPKKSLCFVRPVVSKYL